MASVVTIAVHVASHAHAGITAVRHAITGMLSSLMSTIGSMGSSMGSALSSSMSSAIQQTGKSPQVLGAIAVMVAMIAPLIGTLIGGALTLAIGGALVGVGAMFAAKAKGVKAAWSRTFEDIKKGMADAAKPLEPVLKHAAVLVRDLFTKMKPFLDMFYKTVSPSISLLFDSLAASFAKFGPVLPTLGKAFSQLVTQLSPVFAENISSLASALNGLFKEFAKKDTAHAFARVIGILLGIIPLAIRILRGLTVVFMLQWNAIKAEIIIIKALIKWIARIVGKVVKIGQTGASGVIRWVKSVIGWIRRFVGKTVGIGQRGASTVIGWVKKVIGWIRAFKGKTVSILQRGAGGVTSAVRTAIRWIGSLKGKTIRFAQRGAGAVVTAVRKAIGWIKNLVGKTISIGINVVAKGATGLLKKLNPANWRAAGGIVGAQAGGPRSNLTMVGEQGPELVRLPFGSMVRSNPDTRRMLSGGGGGAPIYLVFDIDGRRLAEAMIDPTRKSIQSRGGVRAAYGKL